MFMKGRERGRVHASYITMVDVDVDDDARCSANFLSNDRYFLDLQSGVSYSLFCIRANAFIFCSVDDRSESVFVEFISLWFTCRTKVGVVDYHKTFGNSVQKKTKKWPLLLLRICETKILIYVENFVVEKQSGRF